MFKENQNEFENDRYIPATNVRSQTPSIRSVINTEAVTNVAKKNTILLIDNNSYY